MIVGLLFIAIIWCLRGFLSYKQVVHNSCNMGTRGLPDIHPQPSGLRPSWFGCIYQANHSCPCYNYRIAGYFRRVFIFGYFEVAFFFENNFLGPSLLRKLIPTINYKLLVCTHVICSVITFVRTFV